MASQLQPHLPQHLQTFTSITIGKNGGSQWPDGVSPQEDFFKNILNMKRRKMEIFTAPWVHGQWVVVVEGDQVGKRHRPGSSSDNGDLSIKPSHDCQLVHVSFEREKTKEVREIRKSGDLIPQRAFPRILAATLWAGVRGVVVQAAASEPALRGSCVLKYSFLCMYRNHSNFGK